MNRISPNTVESSQRQGACRRYTRGHKAAATSALALTKSRKSKARFNGIRISRLFVASLLFLLSLTIGEAEAKRLPVQIGGGKQIRDFSAAEVREAIKLGVEALESRQNASGTWKDFHSYKNGVTALATLALINAADEGKKETPAVKKGITAILKEQSRSTYFVSLRVMCLANFDPKGKRYLREVQKDIDWLVQIQSQDGGWSYGRSGRGGSSDSSNSQFALLALHEATQMGAVVDERVWEATKRYWEICRGKSGGYSYNVGGRNVRRSMSAAGIASEIIIDENLPNLKDVFDGNRHNCCGGDMMPDHEQETVDFIGKQFNLGRPGQGNEWRFYFMYALERAGRLSGRRFFGNHDWYREGVSRLLDWQIGGRGWRGGALEDENVSTAMALLFLAKGKRPIAIGKYLFETPQDKLHRKGVHYLTRKIEKEWEMKLNWQEVRSQQATPDDLLESPVLFMSGNRGFVLTDFQKKSLKTYLENGGFLFADACQGEGCGRADFDKCFRDLMAELFPDSPLDPLPLNHPVWNSFHKLDRPEERPLLGLQACCKTSVIYCPRNLACLWDANRTGVMRLMEQNRRYDRLRGEIEYATKVGVNVVTYATGRDLKEKGDRPKLEGKGKSVLVNRSLVMPKLAHNGGQDEAPNAWRKIQQRFAQTGVSVDFKKKLIRPDLAELGDHPLVFMHGRSAFEFSKAEREAIKAWLDTGFGFLFADSICSSQEFTDSFRSEMEKILGEPLQPIPSDHALWTDKRFLYPIQKVTRRRKREDSGKFEELSGPPELEGHEVNGRLAVVFSPHDLSCAMESTTVSQCAGYLREDAERIGINVLLYRLRGE